MMRRTHGACVTSVLCTRVLVCRAQGSERGRGSGEAKPGARHASLCAITQSRLSAMRAYTLVQGSFCTSACLRFLRSPCAPPPPYSVLLRAALRSALHSPLRHEAQANVGIRKSQEAAKQNGSISSFNAPGRDWHTYANYTHRFFRA